jgi:hypothetical protein
MVRVADGVWARWREVTADGSKPSMSLLFVSRARRAEAHEALCAAASDAVSVLDTDEIVPELGGPPKPGFWRAMVVSGGVLLYVGGEPDDFEGLIGLIVEGLQARGVSGRLELFESSRVAEIPASMPLVEARLRVRGERYDHLGRGQRYAWRADADALRELVIAAGRWCAAYDGPLGLSSTVFLLPRVVVEPEGLEAHLDEALDAVGINSFDLISSGVDGLRMVVVQPNHGRVSLVQADRRLLPDDWQPAVSEVTAFMAANTDRLVYGLVKHGCRVDRVRLGDSLWLDWPPRIGFDAGLSRQGGVEDRFAPDAFAVQLLGPGYAGRIPAGSDWTRRELNADHATLLEHTNPQAWFGFSPAGFVNPGESLPGSEVPEVLARARSDFGDILYLDEYSTPGSMPGET